MPARAAKSATDLQASALQREPPTIMNGRFASRSSAPSFAMSASDGAVSAGSTRGASSTSASLGQDIFGQRHHHRPGPALHRDAKRARDQFGHARGAIDLDHPLGDRPEHLLVVELLERLALAHAALDLADEHDQRRRILRRDVDAVGAVHRAGAAGDEADAGAPGQLAISLRHDRGAAFLAAHQHVDRGVMQRIEHGEKTFAGDAGQPVDALLDELVDQDAAAGAGFFWCRSCAELRGLKQSVSSS